MGYVLQAQMLVSVDLGAPLTVGWDCTVTVMYVEHKTVSDLISFDNSFCFQWHCLLTTSRSDNAQDMW